MSIIHLTLDERREAVGVVASGGGRDFDCLDGGIGSRSSGHGGGTSQDVVDGLGSSDGGRSCLDGISGDGGSE